MRTAATAATAAATTTTTTTTSTWDSIGEDLRKQGGMAVIDLSEDVCALNQECFRVGKKAFDRLEEGTDSNGDTCTATTTATHEQYCHHINSNEDSAHVTGYHDAGRMSPRYNANRRGFVFSDGNTFRVDGVDEFEPITKAMQTSLHTVAQQVLNKLEQDWSLPLNWFSDNMGPFHNTSQWHIKQYVHNDNNARKQQRQTNDDDSNDNNNHDQHVEDWLPMHTDPSLISVIIHDAPGKQEGAMGLQYQAPLMLETQKQQQQQQKQWTEIPFHGHAVATIFVGSVLSYIAGGRINSAKHRVVLPSSSFRSLRPRQRSAITLFLRPQPSAPLVVPPSPRFEGVQLKKINTFSQWCTRVSRNYMKRKKKGEPKQAKQAHTEGEPKYFRDDVTELTLLECNPPLTGQEKYLGGESDGENGNIYTVPGHALRVLKIDCSLEPPVVTPIGPEFPGEYKWLRGVRMCTGAIYAIPCHADSILKIEPETDRVSTIEWDENDPCAPPKGLRWKWHGGNVSKFDDCLYCIPQFAEYVLKIDPRTDKASFLRGDGPLVGRNKWYGGLVGPKDGAIYGINQNARGVLRIDTLKQSVTVHGDFAEGGYKWHGGVLGPDGCIYGIPAHASQVLKIEPGEDPQISLIGSNLRSGEHRNDNKYKFLGGSVGHDGNVYFFPSDADHVLQVNPTTEEVREVGPNLRDLEPIHHNKWQNGFTAPDGSIYGIPLKSSSILRIRPGKDGSNPDITTIGGPYNGLNKWEGGVMSKNGDMYCMPLNHSKVLRMRPVGLEQEVVKRANKVSQYATLRSSAHTLRYSKTRSQGNDSKPVGEPFPDALRVKQMISYDTAAYNLRGRITELLSQADSDLIGTWKSTERPSLEDFVVPNLSLQPKRRDQKAGKGDLAQQTLSKLVADDDAFTQLFDNFLAEVVVPWLKAKLTALGVVCDDEPVMFYCQRPPTLRIQPGPSTRYVNPHSDGVYGHQDGELNFWMPLTDPDLTKTDLWVESAPGRKDYTALGAKFGEVAAFHGSSCSHYVPANVSANTRVSLDFRVGAEGFFDPNWKMLGTKADHNRKTVVQ